jgi:hypothetical protein
LALDTSLQENQAITARLKKEKKKFFPINSFLRTFKKEPLPSPIFHQLNSKPTVDPLKETERQPAAVDYL